ncbi:MAG: shikimate kinase [Syntrophales bacterium]|nr:shikimate kinase [Syntrophales bacterium]
MNVVLIGYRCTGKSSVGERLSQVLHLPFYDTDTLIEKLTGKTIQTMVSENGWEFFREKEREIIKSLATTEESVIATGGGAVMDQENVNILKKNGVLVWLAADVDTIIERMQADADSTKRRPPLSRDDFIQETINVLEERIPVYRRLADFSVDTAGEGIDEIVEQICRFLERCR